MDFFKKKLHAYTSSIYKHKMILQLVSGYWWQRQAQDLNAYGS